MSKILIKIGSADLTPYIKSYAVNYNVLIKENGTNARGDTTINLKSRKSKLNVTFRPTSEAEMAIILAAINPCVVNTEHWDTKTQTQLTKTMFVNSPTTDFYTNRYEVGLFNELSLEFVEL